MKDFVKRCNRMLWWAEYKWLVPTVFLLGFWTWGEVGRWIEIAWKTFWISDAFGGGGGGGF